MLFCKLPSLCILQITFVFLYSFMFREITRVVNNGVATSASYPSIDADLSGIVQLRKLTAPSNNPPSPPRPFKFQVRWVIFLHSFTTDLMVDKVGFFLMIGWQGGLRVLWNGGTQVHLPFIIMVTVHSSRSWIRKVNRVHTSSRPTLQSVRSVQDCH